MSRAIAAALVVVALGCGLCAAPGILPRAAGGMLVLAGCAVYAWDWRRRELPAVHGSWSMLLSDVRGELRRAVAPTEALTLVALGAIIALSVMLRVKYLFQPVRYDEAFTLINFVSVPLIAGLSTYYAPNNHLLHTLLLHPVTMLFGISEWTLRLPAFVAGVLTVPATYIAIRALYGREAGLLSAALVGSSAVFVEFSTNARGYTLLCIIVLLLTSLAAHLRRHWTSAGLFVFGALAALGFFTIPVMLYPWGALMVWLVLSARGGERWPRVLDLFRCAVLTLLLTVLLYLPVLVRTGLGLLVMNRFVEPKSWSEFFSEWPPAAASVWHDWMRHVPGPLEIVLGVGFVVVLLCSRRRFSETVPLPFAAALWIGPVVLVQRVVPFERVWLFLLPLYLGTAVAGVLAIAEPILSRLRWIRSAVVACAAVGLASVLAGRVAVLHPMPLGDAEAAAMFLDGYLRPGDTVVAVVPMDWPLRYYFLRRQLSDQYIPLDADLAATTVRPGRHVLVVDELNGQTLTGVKTSAGVADAESILLWHYDTTTIYEVNAIDRPQ